jgi:hypothetical protein
MSSILYTGYSPPYGTPSIGWRTPEVRGSEAHPPHCFCTPTIRTAATNSSGEDFLMYDDRGISSATYSSSEGDGYSIYSDWNNTDIEPNADMIHMNDIILPTPRIPTSSPPSSPTQPPSVNNEIYNLSKRPRSPVAADLDTANILPLEHRRKRIKPARVRE